MTMSDRESTGGSLDRLDDDLDLLAGLLDAEGIDASDATTIAPRAPGAPVPMSFSQELLWLLDRAAPGLTAYNLPITRRLRGPLDVAALERALTLLVARHESLRARFADIDGAPRLVIDEPGVVTIAQSDLSALPLEEREREAERVTRERARAAFDLTREHLFRASLIRIGADDHVLVLQSHHIVLDGWSMGVLFRELEAAYAACRAGREPTLPAVSLQFGDFAIWQREHLSGPRLETLLDFWRNQLGGASEPLGLATDRPRPAAPTFAGARATLVLSADESTRLRELAQRHDATLYMVLLAGYASVLHRYTGRGDVLVGSGSAGRTLRETESLVGYLNNTLVQRADFSGDPSFAELLGRVRESALAAYDHQEVPLEKLVLELRRGAERLSPAPLFEVVLTMQDAMPASLALDGVVVEPYGVDMAGTKFDLTLLVTDRPDGLRLTAQYRSDLFEASTIERFLGHLRELLLGAAGTPGLRVSALPLLTAPERAALDAWNATTVPEGAAETIVSLVRAHAARVPERSAVVGADGTLTYAQLLARAHGIAQRLDAAGVGRGDRVGLLLDRSADAIVGLLGILEAGGAFVPLSVEAPLARLERQLVESGATIVVTSRALAAMVPSSVSTILVDDETADVVHELEAPRATAADLAYVLYTSGSTGVPKGVAVTHANAVHYARAVSRVLAGIRPDAAGDGFATLDGLRFGMVSTMAADLGYTSVLGALLAGGTLHILPKDAATEPARFAELVTAQSLDVLKITPGHLHALVSGRTGRDLAALLPRRWLVLGGEALRPDLARTILSAGAGRLLNHYGPTETTVGACTFEVTAASLDAAIAQGAQTIPIGQPLANTRAFIVDVYGAEQPIGVPGELVLAGAGVATGYLGRAELTAERFGRRGELRTYRTGDRVRRLLSGAIEFLGRIDDQVKVRGFRVELGEIEQALRALPGVAEAVVALRDGGTGEPVLAAYVVPKTEGYAASHGERATPESLRVALSAQLPEYMVPAVVLLLDSLPLTANGKIDRAALPVPGIDALADRYVAPRTPIEEQLAAIWGEVLKRDRVGARDNFLELGGHSLLAIRVLGKISKSFGVRLPLRTLFDAPTIEQLSAAVEAMRASSAPAAVGIGAVSRDAYRIGKTAPVGESGGSTGGTA